MRRFDRKNMARRIYADRNRPKRHLVSTTRVSGDRPIDPTRLLAEKFLKILVLARQLRKLG
jgi:hypothetical protein